MEVTTTIVVKEEHIDQLGHVNNSIYVSYLENGRGDWYENAGMSFEQMVTRSLGTVVLRLDILYKQEARLGDILTIKTYPVKLGTKSFVLKQDIFNQENQLITEANVTSVMWDAKTRTSIEVVEEFRRHFSKTR